MLRAAEDHAARQALLVAGVDARVAALWRKVRAAQVVASWQVVASSVLQAVVAGQLASARLADGYVDAAVAEQGLGVDRSGTLQPAAFAGAASDGRDLTTLLSWPIVGQGGVLDRIGQGASLADALAAGGSRLAFYAAATLQDAGRSAVGAALVARPRADGYVRALRAPSCARCVILAGRFYRWNAGFQRHLHCDCVHVPSTDADSADLVTDPRSYVASLSSAGQDQLLGKAYAKAARDGADLAQLVNARRGVGINGLTTSEGTTPGGLAGARLGGRQRLTPEGIYAIASDRQEALALLKQHGYLI